MAGPFTHMTIVENATKSFSVETRFGGILRNNINFLTLGSVSPDLPYLSQLAMEGSTWADIMHYYRTNGIVKNALHSLSAAKNKNDIWEFQLAWLLGFVGHLVTDATIHPIVESIVGPYTDESVHSNHRECEMVQDVMILKDVMNLELSKAKYTDFLMSCFQHPSLKKVEDFWAIHAKINCPTVGDFPVDKIMKSYIEILSTAEGGNEIAKVSRHFGSNYFYSTHSDLMEKSPELVKKYYSNIQLPNGLMISFQTDGFDYAVKNLVAIWSKIDRSFFSTENIANIIPNWNLDTGIDQETDIKTYWS